MNREIQFESRWRKTKSLAVRTFNVVKQGCDWQALSLPLLLLILINGSQSFAHSSFQVEDKDSSVRGGCAKSLTLESQKLNFTSEHLEDLAHKLAEPRAQRETAAEIGPLLQRVLADLGILNYSEVQEVSEILLKSRSEFFEAVKLNFFSDRSKIDDFQKWLARSNHRDRLAAHLAAEIESLAHQIDEYPGESLIYSILGFIRKTQNALKSNGGFNSSVTKNMELSRYLQRWKFPLESRRKVLRRKNPYSFVGGLLNPTLLTHEPQGFELGRIPSIGGSRDVSVGNMLILKVLSSLTPDLLADFTKQLEAMTLERGITLLTEIFDRGEDDSLSIAEAQREIELLVQFPDLFIESLLLDPAYHDRGLRYQSLKMISREKIVKKSIDKIEKKKFEELVEDKLNSEVLSSFLDFMRQKENSGKTQSIRNYEAQDLERMKHHWMDLLETRYSDLAKDIIAKVVQWPYEYKTLLFKQFFDLDDLLNLRMIDPSRSELTRLLLLPPSVIELNRVAFEARPTNEQLEIFKQIVFLDPAYLNRSELFPRLFPDKPLEVALSFVLKISKEGISQEDKKDLTTKVKTIELDSSFLSQLITKLEQTPPETRALNERIYANLILLRFGGKVEDWKAFIEVYQEKPEWILKEMIRHMTSSEQIKMVNTPEAKPFVDKLRANAKFGGLVDEILSDSLRGSYNLSSDAAAQFRKNIMIFGEKIDTAYEWWRSSSNDRKRGRRLAR